MLLGFVALLAANSAQSPSMTVADVLSKADSLERKGIFAMFSGDLGQIKAEGARDIQAFGEELFSARAAHRPLPACPPKDGPNSYRLTFETEDVLSFYRSIPPQRRAISSREAFAEYMAKKYPCPKP